MSEMSPEARALIDIGRLDGPSPSERDRVRRGIDLRIATGAASGPLLTAGKGALLAGIVVAAGVSGVVLATRPPSSHLASPGVPNSPAAPVGAAPAAPVPSPEPSLAMPAEGKPAGPHHRAARPAPGPGPAGIAGLAPLPPASTVVQPADALAEELRLIRGAQGALATGKAESALATLAEHAARFPKGVLAEERDAARVQALCALGRSLEARGVADRFLESWPHSAHAIRVRGSCAFELR
jgi:hypothetical protein